MESAKNISTGFGSKVHRGQPRKFVLHSLYGKIVSTPDAPIVIPACMGIRLRVSLDHLFATDEPVTCEKCGGQS